MKIVLSIKKLRVTFIQMLLFLMQMVISIFLVRDVNSFNEDQFLIAASIVCVLCFVIQVFLWRKLTGEWFSPYMVFFLVLFIFSCGQAIGWSTGMDMGGKDMWSRVDHGMTRTLLTKGLCYSMTAISGFHLGAILSKKDSKSDTHKGTVSREKVINAYKNIGKLLIVICIPAFVAKVIQEAGAVAAGGYLAYYDAVESSSTLMRLLGYIADYYQPCLLLLLIAYHEKKIYRIIIVAAMLLEVVITLYIGGRSGAVMALLGILLAYHYFVKPFSYKQIVPSVFFGYLGVVLLDVIKDVRNIVGATFADGLVLFNEYFWSAAGDIIGELGWSITSVCWTMNLVPQNYTYRYGMSYLVSLISWIPSAFFGGKENHPVVIWGNLSQWLHDVQNMGYGPGYTMVAESYLNFGWYGIIVMVVLGFCIARLIGKVPRKYVDSNYLNATFQIMIIMTIMNSLVRSSMSIAFRRAVFVLIPLYFLSWISVRRVNK